MRTTLPTPLTLALILAILPGPMARAVAQAPTGTPKAAELLPPVNPQPAPLSAEEQANVRVYQAANRSVVNVTTRSEAGDDLLALLGGQRSGTGSGSILTKQGHILTNYHVIEDAGHIQVTLYDGSAHVAKVVGVDPNNDLAVLKIDAPAEKLAPIPWADSNKVQVGMRVFALGNPFGLERSLTTGIISSLNRSMRSENQRLIKGIIQTDAAINPGNSGGPLLNRQGELIGINTAIVSRSGQSSGVGFAIPANTARRVVEEILRHGRVIRPDIGILGVLPLDEGVLVARLAPEGPAARAGLRGPEVKLVQQGLFVFRSVDRARADIILAVEGKAVRTLDDLLTIVESKRPGERIALTILRQGRRVEVPIELEESRN